MAGLGFYANGSTAWVLVIGLSGSTGVYGY